MNGQPNAFQKLLHRFVMLQPVSMFFAPRIHRIDKIVLKLTKGKYTVAGILGWDIIQLTTIGAKTSQRHTMPLLALLDGEKIAVIATSFGRKHNPAWYYNLKVHPACEVQFHGRIRKYFAREACGDEYAQYWKLGVSVYAGFEKYKLLAAHRHIPIMVLEPKK